MNQELLSQLKNDLLAILITLSIAAIFQCLLGIASLLNALQLKALKNESNIYFKSSQNSNQNGRTMKATKIHCRRVGSLTFIKLIPIGLFIGYIFLMALVAILAQFGIEHPSVQLGKITGSITIDAVITAAFLAFFESILVIPFLLIGLYVYSKIFTTSVYIVDKKED